jgi:hypothetical protein
MSIDDTISFLIDLGWVEVVGVNHDGEFLYELTPVGISELQDVIHVFDTYFSNIYMLPPDRVN